jgi:hypothetical protein
MVTVPALPMTISTFSQSFVRIHQSSRIRAQPALGLDRYGDRMPGGEGEFGESQAHPRAAIKTAMGNQMLAVARSGLTRVRIGVLVRRVLVAAPRSVGLSSLRSLDKDGKKR